MYYIEENSNPSILEKTFKIIKIQDNKVIIPIKEEYNEKKIEKLAKKTDKFLKKSLSEKIVLSKKLQQNEIYKNLLYYYGYNVVDGRWLFGAMLEHVLNFAIDKMKISKDIGTISFLANDMSKLMFDILNRIAKEYKSVNIVTNHPEKFKNIEKRIYDDDGIILTIMNNKKKSLIKSEFIINLDFTNEMVNKYNIYEKAVIIDINGNIKIAKKRFNGIVINNYEITSNLMNDSAIDFFDISKYNFKDIYESEIYNGISYKEFQGRIKKDNVKIKALYGVNGKIY